MPEHKNAVYCVKNTADDMSYIGSTSLGVGRRWLCHVSAVRGGRCKGLLHPHMAALGSDKFYAVPLEHLPADATREDLMRREQRWIRALKPSLNSHAAFVPAEEKTDRPTRREQIHCGCGSHHRRDMWAKHSRTLVHRNWVSAKRLKATETLHARCRAEVAKNPLFAPTRFWAEALAAQTAH